MTLTPRRLLTGLRRHPWDALGVLAATLYAIPSLAYPFARDHPLHWYIGQRLLEGELPYVSGVSTKPPGVFVLHALSTLLFGNGMHAVRVLDLFVVIVSGVLIATFRATVRTDQGSHCLPPRKDGEIGAAVLAVAILHYTFFDFSDTGHPELWQGALMLGTGWILVRAPGGVISWRRAATAGAVAAMAVTLKHVAAVTGVIGGLFVVVEGLRHQSWRAAMRNAGAYTLGVVGVLALMLAPFVVAGALDAFWEVMVDFILHYAAGADGSPRGLPPWLHPSQALLAASWAGALLWSGWAVTLATRNRVERRVGFYVLLFTLGIVASVIVQKRALTSHTFTYYFVVVTPALALCVVWGLRSARLRASQLIVVALFGAAFFWYAPRGTHVASWSFRAEHESFWAWARGRKSWRAHHLPHRNSFLDDHVHQLEIVDHLRRRMQPGDTLCVDGALLTPYALTEMRCPSRFLSGDTAATLPEWAEEHRRVLREQPPTFYVTFGLRPRVRRLMARGYTRHELRYPDRAWYAILERPRDQ